MKRLLFMCLVFFLIAVGCGKEEKAAEEVAAVVNGEEITRPALAEAALRRYGNRTLDELILEKLIEQEAQAQEVSLTQAEMEMAYARRINQAGGLENFQRALRAAGQTEDTFREVLFGHMLLRKIAEKNLVVTDEEIERVYQRLYGERRTLQEITIAKVQPAVRQPPSEAVEEAISEELPAAPVQEGPPAEETEAVRLARAEAEAVLQELTSGADFTQLAVRRTEPPGARARGGIVYEIPRGILRPELEEVVFSLQVGEISPVLETEEAFHIIKVISITPAQEVALREVIDELRQRVRQERSEALAWEVAERMREDAQIERRFSP
jgi:foldase protein PrsA